ncbi:CBS domain-containing protein [Streptomyces sp. NPDC002676]
MARNVRDIMADAPTAVDSQASVTSVAQVMRDQDIDLVLVMDDGEPMGLVSDRDLMAGAVAGETDPHRMPDGNPVGLVRLGDPALETSSAPTVAPTPDLHGGAAADPGA